MYKVESHFFCEFLKVYQIVYVLLRMGDSPRPANWILERSVDGEVYHPWVFFAKTEYDCKKLYEPLIDRPLTITSGPRPWHLGDDEVSIMFIDCSVVLLTFSNHVLN